MRQEDLDCGGVVEKKEATSTALVTVAQPSSPGLAPGVNMEQLVEFVANALADRHRQARRDEEMEDASASEEKEKAAAAAADAEEREKAAAAADAEEKAKAKAEADAAQRSNQLAAVASIASTITTVTKQVEEVKQAHGRTAEAHGVVCTQVDEMRCKLAAAEAQVEEVARANGAVRMQLDEALTNLETAEAKLGTVEARLETAETTIVTQDRVIAALTTQLSNSNQVLNSHSVQIQVCVCGKPSNTRVSTASERAPALWCSYRELRV